MSLLSKTSNPAFSGYFWDDDYESYKKMTVGGILLKTLFLLFITTTIVVLIWKMHSNGSSIKWFGTGGVIGAIVVSIVLSVRQQWAHILVPLY